MRVLVDFSGHCIDTEAFKIPLPIKEAFGKTLNPFLIAPDFFHLFFLQERKHIAHFQLKIQSVPALILT